MTIDDLYVDDNFDSFYAVPVTNSADRALAGPNPQAEYPTDLSYYFCNLDSLAGVAPDRNVYAHESAPYSMNPLAIEVETTLMAAPASWQWIPDQPQGHRGNTGPVVAQAPEIDPYTQPLMPEPRRGYGGVYPFEWHTALPFPNAWE